MEYLKGVINNRMMWLQQIPVNNIHPVILFEHLTLIYIISSLTFAPIIVVIITMFRPVSFPAFNPAKLLEISR